MKNSLFYILTVLLSINAVHANTDKTKTELRDAIYTNCTKDVKSNAKIINGSSVCSCVADNTLKALDTAAFNASFNG